MPQPRFTRLLETTAIAGSLALVLLLQFRADANAQTSWTAGAGSTDFENPANWSPSGVPGATSDVIVNKFGSPRPAILDTSRAVGSLTIGQGGTVGIASGGSLEVNGPLTISGTSISTGEDDGDLTVFQGGTLRVARAEVRAFGILSVSGRVEGLGSDRYARITSSGGVTINATGQAEAEVIASRAPGGQAVVNNRGYLFAANVGSNAVFNNFGGAQNILTAVNGGEATNEGTIQAITVDSGAAVNLGSVTVSATVNGGSLANFGTITNTTRPTVNVSGGSLTNHAGGTLNSVLTSGTGIVTNAGTVAGDVTVDSGQFANTGTIGGNVFINGGLFSLGGSVNGSLNLSGGTIETSGTLSRTISATSGTLRATGNLTLAGPGPFTLGGPITLDTGTFQVTSAQGIDFGTGGTLTKTGTGTLRLDGAGTGNGTLVVSQGTLQVGQGAALGTAAVTLGGTLAAGAGGLTLGNAIALSAPGGTIDAAAQTFTLNGNITGGAGAGLAIASSGAAGTVRLGGTNSYLGPTTIATGATLLAASAGALSANSAFTVNGTLSLGGFDSTVAGLSGAGNVGNGAAGPVTLTIAGTGTTTFTGTVADAGAGPLAVIIGGGTQVFAGSGTYTGGTTINAGTLALQGGSALADAGAVTLANAAGAVLAVNASETIGSLAGGGAAGGTVTIAAGQTLTTGGAASTTFAGAITGAGSLAKQGAGVFTLTGPNAHTGATTVGAGTLRGGAANAFSAASATTVNAGGTLDLGGVAQTIDAVTLAGGTIANGSLGGAVSSSGGAIVDVTGGARLSTTGGVTTLTGTNGFGAPVAVGAGTLENRGTLSAGAEVAAGATFDNRGSAGAVSNAGTLTNAAGATLATLANSGNATNLGTIAGAASNAGTLANSGLIGGTLANTSGTTANSGTIAGRATVSGGRLANTGTVADVSAGAGATFDNAGSAGAVTNAGTGTNAGTLASLANTGAFSNLAGGRIAGGATVEAGTLTNAGGIAGPVTVAGGALTTTGALGGGLANAGTVNASGTIGGPILNQGAFTVTGDLAATGSFLNAGTGTLSVAGGNLTGVTTFTNRSTAPGGASVAAGRTLSGGSIVNEAGATLANAGTLAADVVRNDGTLVNTGTIAGLTVNTGTLTNNGILGALVNTGTLSGAGVLARLEAVAGSVVAPGNSIGTLNVAGNVSFAPGSVYQVEVNAAGQSDLIAATGTATLTGGTVQVLAEAGTYQPRTTYTILTAAGGVTGKFATVTTNYAFLTPTLLYDPTQVRLELRRNDVSFAGVTTTSNQGGTGRSVEALGLGSPVYDALLTATAPTARTALDLLSGEVHATALTTAIETSRFVREGTLNRLRGLGSPLAYASGPAVPAAYAADLPGRAPVATPVTVRTLDPRAFGLWGQGFGSWGRTDRDGNAAGADRSTGGFLLGADATFDERWRVGFAGGYSRTTFDVNERLSSGELEAFHGALYAGASFGAVQVRLGAAASFDRYDTRRAVRFAGFGDTLRADYDGSTVQAFGELGYRVGLGAVTLEPFVGAAALRASTDRFAETGGAAALAVGGSDAKLGYTTLGLRGEAALGAAAPLFVRGMVGWRHAFGDTTPSALAAFRSGGPGFRVSGLPVDRDSLVAEAGLDWRVSERAVVGLSYTGAIGERAQDHGVRGSVEIRF